MPVQQKIKALIAGKKVKPPKGWFNMMLRQIKKEYPNRSSKAQQRIAAGIWHKYKKETKIKIIMPTASISRMIKEEINSAKRYKQLGFKKIAKDELRHAKSLKRISNGTYNPVARHIKDKMLELF